MCLGRKGQGRINRLEGGVLLACFVAYTGWLLTSILILDSAQKQKLVAVA